MQCTRMGLAFISLKSLSHGTDSIILCHVSHDSIPSLHDSHLGETAMNGDDVGLERLTTQLMPPMST